MIGYGVFKDSATWACGRVDYAAVCEVDFISCCATGD